MKQTQVCFQRRMRLKSFVSFILRSLWETLALAAAKQLSFGAKQSMQQLEK